jgi:mycothiol synthase
MFLFPEEAMQATIRHYNDRLRPEILALWGKALPLDVPTESIFESRVLLDENFDPESFLLAFDGDRLAGFVIGYTGDRMALGDADPQGTYSWVTVLALDPVGPPDAAGTPLMDALEQRFKSMGKTVCSIADYPPAYFTPGIDKRSSAALIQFLQSRGYMSFHEALSMDSSIVLFTPGTEVDVQESRLRDEGVEFRTYCATDLVNFLAFLERSMPSDWVRVERRNLRKMSEGTFLPEQITIVTRNGEIIGYCQYEGSHFGPFGVSEAFQGHGIGTVLLSRTLERMKRAGFHDAWVMWTDDRAAKVYGKFGFHETRRFVLLRKTL